MAQAISPPAFQSQSAEQIAARLQAGEDLLLIDIREPAEWAIVTLPQAQLLAMSRINDWWQDLPSDREVIVFCHHGARSAQVCAALAHQAGLTNLTNMQGGIHRWALMVDPSLPRY